MPGGSYPRAQNYLGRRHLRQHKHAAIPRRKNDLRVVSLMNDAIPGSVHSLNRAPYVRSSRKALSTTRPTLVNVFVPFVMPPRSCDACLSSVHYKALHFRSHDAPARIPARLRSDILAGPIRNRPSRPPACPTAHRSP
jgi:hypothetical protein